MAAIVWLLALGPAAEFAILYAIVAGCTLTCELARRVPALDVPLGLKWQRQRWSQLAQA